MTYFDLGISTSYVPKWGIWEGAREIIQNARDAFDTLDSGMSLDYDKDSQVLSIKNENIVLPKKVWLLGYTTKADNEASRGQWGEGLKIACLSLVRKGNPVSILNGIEIWTPKLAYSKEYDAEVLRVYITIAKENDENDFIITIENVLPEQWNIIQERILFLQDRESYKTKRSLGSVLYRQDDVGEVFVKDLWVKREDDLLFGYNFKALALDRDREVVNNYQMKFHAVQILDSVCLHHADIREKVIQQCLWEEDPCIEIKTILDAASVYSNIPNSIVEYLEDKIPNTVICRTVSQLTKVLSFACEAKLVTKIGYDILQYKRYKMTFDNWIQSYSNIPTKTYSIFDLSTEERIVFYDGLILLQEAFNLLGKEVMPCKIVEFNGDKIIGFYRKGEQVEVARDALDNLPNFLRVLIHEQCHQYGDDGTVEHTRAIENTNIKIHDTLLKKIKKYEDNT
jgi:hypothetical protein